MGVGWASGDAAGSECARREEMNANQILRNRRGRWCGTSRAGAGAVVEAAPRSHPAKSSSPGRGAAALAPSSLPSPTAAALPLLFILGWTIIELERSLYQRLLDTLILAGIRLKDLSL